jgi:hypothetical protein
MSRKGEGKEVREKEIKIIINNYILQKVERIRMDRKLYNTQRFKKVKVGLAGFWRKELAFK